MQTDKLDEINLYDKEAQERISFLSWQSIFPKYLQFPYRRYLKYFEEKSKKEGSLKVLELCCGMGEFTFDIGKTISGDILAFDISPESINLCQREQKKQNINNIKFQAADVENLQLPSDHFDIICMSGSLSCLNLEILFKDIKTWLKPDGWFIAVDTYGYSPIFNLKRKLNYLHGKRTKHTVLNIPKKPTIDAICNLFNESEVHFYGTFAFVGPFLKYIIGENLTAKFVNACDWLFPFLNRFAFKFVLCTKGVKKGED